MLGLLIVLDRAEIHNFLTTTLVILFPFSRDQKSMHFCSVDLTAKIVIKIHTFLLNHSLIACKKLSRFRTSRILHKCFLITLNYLSLYVYFIYACFYKRYCRIDQHLAHHFVNYGAGLLSSPPFLCSQTITPFCNSIIFSNQENRVLILVNCGILIPFFLFYSRIYFVYMHLKLVFSVHNNYFNLYVQYDKLPNYSFISI